VVVERLRYLGDLPLSLDLTNLAPDIGTQFLGHPLETNDLFALIEQVSGQRLGSARPAPRRSTVWPPGRMPSWISTSTTW
jgi:DNA-binding GntR family transcriptional regulator